MNKLLKMKNKLHLLMRWYWVRFCNIVQRKNIYNETFAVIDRPVALTNQKLYLLRSIWKNDGYVIGKRGFELKFVGMDFSHYYGVLVQSKLTEDIRGRIYE